MVSAMLLLILYAFTVSHVDCNTISTWGYDLLDSIRRGALREFPEYTYQAHGMATNYTLFSNIITAIWLTPVFILDCLIGAHFEMVVYDVWFKVLILCVLCAALIIFYRILLRLKYDRRTIEIGCFVFATSAILLVSVLGKGQIDSISVFFVLLAIYCLYDEKILYSFLFLGIACLFKPFAILLGIPYLLLSIGKMGKKLAYCILFLIGPYIADYVITRLLMPEYGRMSDITNSLFKETFGLSRIEELFAVRINAILLFFGLGLLICFIAFCVGIRNKTSKIHIVLLPPTMYLTYILFVNASSVYWLINILPIIVMIGLRFDRIEDFLILNTGINIGVCMYFPIAEKGFAPAKSYSVLHSLRDYNSSFDELLSGGFNKYIIYISVTLYIVCIILIPLIYLYEQKLKATKPVAEHTKRDNSKKAVNSLLIISILPQMMYLLMVCVVF